MNKSKFNKWVKEEKAEELKGFYETEYELFMEYFKQLSAIKQIYVSHILPQLDEYRKPTRKYKSPDGNKIEEWQDLNQKNHRIGFPAFIMYDDDNQKIISEAYYIHGNLHRDNDLPALIKYYRTGQISEMIWYVQNENFRSNNKPCYINYFPNGQIQSLNWSYDLNEDNKLITLIYDENKNIICKSFYRKPSNNTPITIRYYSTGQIKSKEWNPKTCNIDTPYHIDYDKQGNIIKKHFYFTKYYDFLTKPIIQEFNDKDDLIKNIWEYKKHTIKYLKETKNSMSGRFVVDKVITKIESHFNDNKQLHNSNGYAVIIDNGTEIIKEWWLNGIHYLNEMDYLIACASL